MARTRSDMPPAFTKLVPNNEATPVAFRDVCVNYDKRFLAEQNLRVPTSFEDLIKPEFKGKLVIESPITSSVGLAFLLATISHFGPMGWQPYWTALKANNVKVVNSWAEAYQSNFTAGSPSGLAPGAFPLVVAYGSSPANALALSPNPAANEAPTGVIESTCVRDVEFAAIVIGTRHQAEATQLIEFLSSVPVQEDVPLSMFIHPANSKARLPTAFADFTVRPAAPIALDPKQIEANKPRWLAEWKSLGS
jgi:thiamine transport system substrate-binding protein